MAFPRKSSQATALTRDRSTSRIVLLMVMAQVALWLSGCVGFAGRHRGDSMSGIQRPRFSDDPQVEEVVDHLNRNVQKLHAWQANSVKIRANNIPLSGTLAVEEGHHLRLVVHSLAGNEVDMGSNDEVFWIWAKRMDPCYVYCRHEQIDAARQALGVPFEPQWLMQALGVAPLDPHDLQMQIDTSSRRARLVQPVVSAHGFPMKKVMLVDLAHGVITEHSIYDGAGRKIAQAKLDDFHLDKKSGVTLPRRVKLEWPQNQMTMVMYLGRVEVNPTSIASRIWQMPEMPGVQMVDLGAQSMSGSGTRMAGTEEPRVELMEPEDVPGHEPQDPHPPSRVKIGARATPHASENEIRTDRNQPLNQVEFRDDPVAEAPKRNWYD